MRNRGRLATAVGSLVLMGSALALGNWLKASRQAPPTSTAAAELRVDTGSDQGPGSLREALFTAAATDRHVTIVVGATPIALESPLPPLVNPHGIRIVGPTQGVEIDARGLGPGPVFDVDAEHSSISGLRLRNCAGTGVLVRASAFQIESADIGACDVGVDVADNAHDVSIEHSQFSKNRVGVRFSGSSRHSVVAGSRFSGNTDAGLWATRGSLDVQHGVAVNVHDNSFDGDRIGVLVGNVALGIERNTITGAREAGIYVVGAGVVVRSNRISGGPPMGIIADGTRGVVIEDNEVSNLSAYGLLVRNSANALIQRNRIHHCGYGMGFVLGSAREPSSAVDNSIIALQYDGIDVIGDSPTLRRNRVLEARVQALKVESFRAADGTIVAAHPFLADNMVGASGGTVVPPTSAPTVPLAAAPK